MTTGTIAGIVVIIYLILFLVIGFRRGLLRMVLAGGSLVITLIIAGAAAQPAADYIRYDTAIGPKLQQNIEDLVESKLGGVGEALDEAEDEFIDSLLLPSSVKSDLKEKNTLARYADQGVDSFKEYIAVNLTGLIIRVVSYVLIFIIVFILIKIIVRLSRFINKIPIIGGFNRILGALLGFMEAVIFLWIACIIISLLSATDFGIACVNVINESKFLMFIYNNNYLSELALGVSGLFKAE